MQTDKYQKVRELIEQNNGILSAKEARDKGIQSWYLAKMTRAGELERVGRGIYYDPTFESYDEQYFFQLLNQVCIYSYQSALYLHQLTDRLPFIDEVTVYQGYNAWRIKDQVSVHWVSKKHYPIGVTEVKTPMGNPVRVYNKERTLCDILRDRKKQDPEIFSKAFHLYLRQEDKDIWKLRDFAMIFGVEEALEEVLEVITYE